MSTDQKSWTEVACGRNFNANNDGWGQVNVLFPEVVVARYVRILPQQ